MKIEFKSVALFLFKLYLLSLFVMPFLEKANALSEVFDLYAPPQALSMGNAQTSEATGYLANYYNPAGLAKGLKRKWEVVLLGLEGNLGTAAIGHALSARSFGIYRLFDEMRRNPGYSYFKFSGVPAISTRNFSFSLLATYQYAALSDGTMIDMNAINDVGATVGTSSNFFKNMLKLGITAKGIARNQMKGNYDFASLANDRNIAARMASGIGLGADIGMMFTLPIKWLPSVGVVCKDVGGTRFNHSAFLNADATGTPESIPQSFNMGFSMSPKLSRKIKSTFAFDFRHIERTDLLLRKKLHVGAQLEFSKSFYLWLGMNQLFVTGGVALRLPGGNLELGSYGQDIGDGDTVKEDRRVFFRYTISF